MKTFKNMWMQTFSLVFGCLTNRKRTNLLGGSKRFKECLVKQDTYNSCPNVFLLLLLFLINDRWKFVWEAKFYLSDQVIWHQLELDFKKILTNNFNL